MPEPSVLFWALMFGAVGMGYFVWGKNQARFAAIGAGVLLCVFPYFVSELVWMLLVGALLVAAPWVFKF